MQFERGRITAAQLAFMVTGYVLGSSVLLVPGMSAKRDSWLAVAAGAVEGVAIAAVYLKLASRFSGKTLTQIMENVYGPIIGRTLVIPYIWFFLHLCSLVLGNYVDFLTIAVMPETPSIAFAVLAMVAAGSAARNGVEVIARCSEVLIPLMLALVLVAIALSTQSMDLKNLLPVMDIPWTNFLWATHGAATFPFAETITFVAVLPFVGEKGATRSVISATLVGGALLVLLSIRNTAVLGAAESMFVYPSFEALRLINIARIITRMEVLVVVNFLFMGFIKMSVLLYGTTLTLAEFLNLRSYLHLVYPVGVAVMALQTINFANVAQNFEFVDTAWPIYALPFELGLPLLTLTVAAIRGLPRKESKNDI